MDIMKTVSVLSLRISGMPPAILEAKYDIFFPKAINSTQLSFLSRCYARAKATISAFSH